MTYLGGKSKLAKHFIPLILSSRNSNQYYVEPFVGGANVIDKVKGLRIASDNNFFLIEMYKAIQKGWIPPDEISEEYYNEVKNNQNKYPPELVSFVGFCSSFSAKWFGGYARGKNTKGNWRNYALESKNKLLEQFKTLKDVEFIHSEYWNLSIPIGSIIYCDPPYKNTTEYKDKFDSNKFWLWAENMSNIGHKVFVSEIEAPSNWKTVWSLTRKSSTSIGNYKTINENLFILDKYEKEINPLGELYVM